MKREIFYCIIFLGTEVQYHVIASQVTPNQVTPSSEIFSFSLLNMLPSFLWCFDTFELRTISATWKVVKTVTWWIAYAMNVRDKMTILHIYNISSHALPLSRSSVDVKLIIDTKSHVYQLFQSLNTFLSHSFVSAIETHSFWMNFFGLILSWMTTFND